MYYFHFEKDFIDNGLTCIPMCVRLKLDLIGIKLSLKQWARLEEKAKHTIVHMDVESTNQRKKLEDYLIHKVMPAEEEPLLRIHPIQTDQEIKIETFIALNTKLDLHDLYITWSQWESLTVLQRFAIGKLLRPGHESKNLWPALEEFGLISHTPISCNTV